MTETRADRRIFERNAKKPIEKQLAELDFMFRRTMDDFIKESCREYSDDIIAKFMQNKFGFKKEKSDVEKLINAR